MTVGEISHFCNARPFIWCHWHIFSNVSWICSTSTTGYNQSVTGRGSQRSHVVVTQRKLM